MKAPFGVRAMGVVSALVLASLSCTDSASVTLIQVEAKGAVVGLTFLDNNGNGQSDGVDTPFPHLIVRLTATRGGEPVATAETDTTGIFRMTDVPVGSYRVSLDPASVGDSLDVSGGDVELQVRRDSTSQATIGVSFPVLSFEEIRAGTPGRKVFTSGIALNPRPNFGDGVVHLQADSIYLRAINVERANIATGDSLRLLGRIASSNGQPVLDQVTPYVLVNIATIPVPLERHTGPAATAEGGKIDAALLRVRAAEIHDTSTVNGDFHFFVDDGTGPIEVVLRSFLQANTSVIRPDTILRMKEATGLLTAFAEPTGGVRWRLLPRAGADVTLEIKQADLAIDALLATDSTVVKGDVVTFTVVVTNKGPLAASGVQVIDSVPTGFTYVSAKTSRGTYTQGTAIWALDSLAVAAKDTLFLKAEVTTDLFGTTQARARVKAPVNEVDPTSSNDAAALTMTVQPPAPAPKR